MQTERRRGREGEAGRETERERERERGVDKPERYLYTNRGGGRSERGNNVTKVLNLRF